MDVQAVIKLLLDRINTRKQFVAGIFGAFEGTTGNMYMQQKDFNTAVTKWCQEGDVSGLKQLASSLQIYGNLADAEYEQVMMVLSEADR